VQRRSPPIQAAEAETHRRRRRRRKNAEAAADDEAEANPVTEFAEIGCAEARRETPLLEGARSPPETGEGNGAGTSSRAEEGDKEGREGNWNGRS
jgi:hypothetical protein